MCLSFGLARIQLCVPGYALSVALESREFAACELTLHTPRDLALCSCWHRALAPKLQLGEALEEGFTTSCVSN